MKENVYKLPSQFLDKLRKIMPTFYPQVVKTFLSRKKQTFRVNYLKIDLKELRHLLKEERIKCKELVWPEGSFILQSQLRKLQNSYIYRKGLIYVQNISSMIPVLCLDLREGERVLDLCAAPGAKTTQIVSLTRGKIQLVAVEKTRVRYYKLLANLKIQGAERFVETYLYDGVRIRNKFPQYFDKILLDTPCSCESLFYINNPHSFKYWKERKVKEMAHKQKRLIQSAFHSLKRGGILVYSTCTFSPEENEEVIDWLLRRFKQQVEILPLHIPLKNTLNGLLSWHGKKFSSSLRLTQRILPTDCMESFFIAKLRKTK